MIPYNTIPEQHSPDSNDPSLRNRRLISIHANEQIIFSEHDNNIRPGFALNESPDAHALPTFPMFASFSSDDEESENDDNVSLVSSLSRDDSLVRFAPWQPHQSSLMMNRDILAAAVAQAHHHHHGSLLPPVEIIISIKEKKAKVLPLSVKPDWLRDDFDALIPSPMSSMSYSSSDNWDVVNRKMTRSSFSSTLGLLTSTPTNAEPSIPRTPINDNEQNIFRPAVQQASLINDRPEPARRAVTFPEATTSSFPLRSSAFQPFQPATANVLPKGTRHNEDPPETTDCPVLPPPQPLAFQRSKSLPQNHHFTNKEEDLLMMNHIPETSYPSDVTPPIYSSPDHVKLLGQRQNRAVGDFMLHHHGTVAGVGSEAGQISFYTAPTTSSSTGGDEGFQHHVKVQGMLNTLVLGGGADSGTAAKTQRGRRKDRKLLFWRFMGKQQQRPPGLGPHAGAIKQPAGFFS